MDILDLMELSLEDLKYLGSHDLIVLPTGEVVMNHSRASRVVAFNPKTWAESRILLELAITEETEKGIATNGFLRGMSYLPEQDLLLIGCAPASVYVLFNASSRNKDFDFKKIELSDEIVESVFDVIPHDSDWKLSSELAS